MGRLSQTRAVVIGSGIGGTAATLLLAEAGIPVTLVEKNRRIGGSCSGYEKRGFHVDIGTHMFSRGGKGPLGDVLRRVGADGAIRFVRTHDIAELRFLGRRPPQRRDRASPQLHPRWSHALAALTTVLRRWEADAHVSADAHASTDARASADAIDLTRARAFHATRTAVRAVRVPSDLARMPRFAFELARALDLSVGDALRAARLFSYILSMSDAEVASWDHRTIEELIEPFTDHAPTIGIFGFLLGLYFILPYWEVSAGEALLCFRHMARDNALSYPKGGAIAIPSTYVDLAKERRAEVRTGTGVRRVIVRNAEVTGVELEDGTVLPASIVVSTSSLRTTVQRLVGAEHFPDAYVRRAMAIRGSFIAVQAKIGLTKRLVDSGCLVGGVGEHVDLASVDTADMKAMFGHVARGEVPPIVPFYCPVPTNFDPDLAPPGHQLLTLCAVAPTTDVKLSSPASAWEEAMLRTIRRVVPGLDDHVAFIDTFGVEFIERWIGKEFGPAVSTAQTPDQVGSRRPSVFTPIRGLYLAGCNAGGRGVGTELAASSAMECVDRILVDVGRELDATRSATTTTDDVARFVARAARRPVAWATRV